MCVSVLVVALYLVCILFFYLSLKNKLCCNIKFLKISFIFLTFYSLVSLGVKIWNIQHYIYGIAFTSFIFMGLGWDLETMHLVLITFWWTRGLKWMSHAVGSDYKKENDSWSSLFQVVSLTFLLSLSFSLGLV